MCRQAGIPKKLGKEHICSACRAVVDIVIRKTGAPKRRRESTVVEAMDAACNFENLRIYEFPPPTMQQACAEFLSEHEDAVEEGVLKQVLPSKSRPPLTGACNLLFANDVSTAGQ
ncbi:MAG: hypothetical protein ACPIOQ_24055, partial [Promethearchaeia archaeon]